MRCCHKVTLVTFCILFSVMYSCAPITTDKTKSKLLQTNQSIDKTPSKQEIIVDRADLYPESMNRSKLELSIQTKSYYAEYTEDISLKSKYRTKQEWGCSDSGGLYIGALVLLGAAAYPPGAGLFTGLGAINCIIDHFSRDEKTTLVSENTIRENKQYTGHEKSIIRKLNSDKIIVTINGKEFNTSVTRGRSIITFDSNLLTKTDGQILENLPVSINHKNAQLDLALDTKIYVQALNQQDDFFRTASFAKGHQLNFSTWKKTFPYRIKQNEKKPFEIIQFFSQLVVEKYLALEDQQFPNKIPQPKIPPQLVVKQGKFEPTRNFEKRVKNAMKDREKQIEKLQRRTEALRAQHIDPKDTF